MKLFLKIVAWIPFISQLKNFLVNYQVIIQVLNIIFLCHEDITIITFKCFTFDCFIKTIIHHASTNVHTFFNSLNYYYFSTQDDCELMMMYDIHMRLKFFNTTTTNT
jgi:hypothetical protein